MALSLPQPLEMLRFPLRGSHLIEASAGTGKTFTIAMLYVRLVLGHGDEQGFTRALTPPEILVVTFTDAATQELRDRIRARLSEAAECFRCSPDDITPRAAGEDVLHDLRNEYPPDAWPGCARKLQLAAEWMDEAAVSTIHGWCNRMLSEHAFDSDSLFSQRLETNQSELLLEVVRDYWRTWFFPLGVDQVVQVRQWWIDPEMLYVNLQPLLDHVELLAAPQPPEVVFNQCQQQKSTQLAALKAPWLAWCDELKRLLDEAVATKAVNGRVIQARYYDPWLEALRHWASGDDDLLDLKTGWLRLTPEGMRQGWKDPDLAPQHPAFDAIATLPASLAALPNACHGILQHACGWVSARFQQEQQRRAQMGFNDLLTRLDSALHSENGPRLAGMIRQQFPLALIDEFQDTDPLQYRIFNAIYQIAANDPQQGVVLIGDPKQAIYAFRGADIYTYLQARRDTAGRHYTLGTNFRSTQRMVDAVNQVFASAENRPAGRGAFLFRREQGDNPVPFQPVQAQGRAERWWVEGSEGSALTLMCAPDEDTLSNGDYRQLMATHCAQEIVRLLLLGQQGAAGFTRDGGDITPLQPGDIAVLVNTGREADAVREALRRRGVRSVYLSDKESVYASPRATEIQFWLAACVEPENDRLLRAALGTPALGLSWLQLDRLNHDEREWEQRVAQFQQYHKVWRFQGVLPLLRRLMWDFNVPERLLNAGDSRSLTDLLHLAELLQQASVELEGEHALLRFLAEQRLDQGNNNDVMKLRLESDAALVKVVTVHKSKGLEYPLVFLPFACAFRAVKASDSPLKWHDDQGQLQLAIGGDAAQVALADDERLGEDIRKWYVALTRARYAMWLGMAPLKGAENSAAGYLLQGSEPGQMIATLEAQYGAVAQVQPLPEPDERMFTTHDPQPALRSPLATPDLRSHRWRITSYSRLKYSDTAWTGINHHEGEEVQSAAQETLSEPDTGLRIEPVVTSGDDLFGFPRGTVAGNFLHGLLEWAGQQGFAQLAQDRAQVEDQIARRCNRRGWQHWIPPLTDWMMSLLNDPLPLAGDDSFSLAGLHSSEYQVEMEFWFGLKAVRARKFDELVIPATLGGLSRMALAPDEINGMLKGFIDLIFQHNGRYYVLDYKSNWLGGQMEDYDQVAMVQSMIDHRYDLQLVIYLFALHRLLKSRLPDYDYDRHVGGALYLFLRGHPTPGKGACLQRPEKALMEQLEQLFRAHEGL